MNQSLKQIDLKIDGLHSTVGPRASEVGALESTQVWPNLQTAMVSLSDIREKLEYAGSKLSGLEAKVAKREPAASGGNNIAEAKAEEVFNLVGMLFSEIKKGRNFERVTAVEDELAVIKKTLRVT